MPWFIGWVPTAPEYINRFFDLAPVTETDIVFDLGSGDGRLVFAALERGAGKAYGIDLNPELIDQAREEARKKGLDGKATFIQCDVMDIDLK